MVIELLRGQYNFTLLLWGAALMAGVMPSLGFCPTGARGETSKGGCYTTSLLLLGVAGVIQWGPNFFSAAAFISAAWVASFFGGRKAVLITVVAGTFATALVAALSSDIHVGDWDQASAWIFGILALAAAMAAVGAMNLFVLRGLDRAVLNLTSSLERERSAREEQQHVQEELANARRVEALGRLAAGIAHDMNNALMVVLGNVSVLRDRPGASQDDHAILDDVTQAAEGAREIVRQLLVLGSQDTKSPGISNIEDVLSRLRKPLERLLPENIDVVMHRHADAWVPLGRAEVERILLNLALNARDAMNHGGVLTIDARAREQYVVIRVSDTGQGMDEETRARIFEPFFTTKEVERGTGLGLSTVKGLVRGALGTIEVQSDVGKGSTFRVALPRVGPPAAEKDDPQRITPPPSRVLVVEDDAGVRSSLVRMLRADGHRTIEAENALDAEAVLASAGTFDLMLTDAVMPNSDVPRLIEVFHNCCPKAPLIICSGWVQEELVRQGIATGDYLFLEKPFTQNALREVIAKAIGARRPSRKPLPQAAGHAARGSR